MGRYLTLLPVLLLVFLAGLTYWLDRQLQFDLKRNAQSAGDPDFIVDNFTASRMGPNGAPQYTLSARRMLHYPHNDTTVLESPRFSSTARNGTTITATARSATLSSNGEEAFLRDDVLLVRSPSRTRKDMTIATSYLRVIPEKNYAVTDREVRISDANTLSTSVGLEFDGNKQIVSLLSNVRITYNKAPFKQAGPRR